VSTAVRRSRPSAPIIHLGIALWVPICAIACWWQITVALGGDGLGWLYSIEWPVFGIFGIVVWWNLIHDDPDEVGARAVQSGHALPPRLTERDRAATTRVGGEESPELERYNDYLEALAAKSPQKTWRH
jgi:DNA-binding transcriptional regulator of glucitol operon